MDVIQEILQHNKNVATSGRNRVGDSTPLHLAALGGHAELVQCLVLNGASALVEDGVSDSL